MVIRKESSWLEMFCMIACCTCILVFERVVFEWFEWELRITYRFRYSSWCFSRLYYCLVLFQTRRRRDFLKTRLKLFENVRFDSRTISKCFVRRFCERLVLVRFFRSWHSGSRWWRWNRGIVTASRDARYDVVSFPIRHRARDVSSYRVSPLSHRIAQITHKK